MPHSREITLLIHNWETPVHEVEAGGERVPTESIVFDEGAGLLTIELAWKGHQALILEVK